MTPSLKKHWPLIGIGLLIILVGLHLFRASRKTNDSSSSAGAGVERGLKLGDIHYSQNNPDDRVKWFLDAKEATVSSDSQVVFFHDFKLRVSSENRPHMELEGQKGTYYRNTGEIHLQGALRGSTGDGYRIATESAVYNQKLGSLETDDPVKITGPLFSVEGRGLRLNTEKETLLIPWNVTTLIKKGLPAL